MIRLIIWCKPFSKYFLVILALAIIVVSSIPNVPTLKIHTTRAEIRLDYLMHFCEYGVLAFMAHLAFSESEFNIRYRKFIFITLCLIMFAILDEYHQKLIPGRTYNLTDIFSNVTGILVSTILILLVFGSVRKRIKKVQ